MTAITGRRPGPVLLALGENVVVHAGLDVEARRRGGNGPGALAVRLHPELERGEDAHHFRRRDVEAQQAPDVGLCEADHLRREGRRVVVNHAREDLAPRVRLEQLRRARGRGAREFRVHAASEPGAGLAEEVEGPRGATDRHGVELGRLEEDPPGGSIHLGIGTPHDSRQRDRPDGIGNDQHVGRQGAVLTVERLECFARPGETNGDLHGLATRARLEFVQVEGVQGLALLEHDKIGDINRGADRPHSR